MSLKLPKSCKLLSPEDFNHLRSNSKVVHTSFFLFVFKKNNLPNGRLGLSFSKKLGNAVFRNYLKRIAREHYRLSNFRHLNFDLHIIGKHSLSNCDDRDLIRNQLRLGFERIQSEYAR